MHPEVEELRPKLKEFLYDCAVEIRATKAALYLFDGSSRFELITEYGFRGAVRQSADFNDPLVDRCGRGRSPFFVNGVGVEPRLSELMFASDTDRLLAAPLYTRGKLVGFIDMRDKAGKQPFDNADVQKAQGIADRIVDLFADKNVFNLRYITLSKMSGAHPAVDPTQLVSDKPPVRDKPLTAAVPPVQPPPQQQQPAPAPEPEVPRVHHNLASLVIDARAAAGRIASAPPSEMLTEAEIAAAAEVLRAILLLPDAAVAAFSAFGHLGGVQEIAARSILTDEASTLLQSKLNVWLNKRGEAGGYLRTTVHAPLGTSGPAIRAADLQKVFTAPLTVGSLHGLYLTVAFSGAPDRGAHELLAVLHNHLQLVLEQSISRGALNAVRARAAEKLLEPDFTKYPKLRRHVETVARLAETFARYLALPPADVENARLLGLVHDVGMRLLDYDRLYRKKDLSNEELGFLREHPVVGAAVVEPLLGVELARAVLCHHERVDGRGYPGGLHGPEIPILARIVQICDAWVAMTDADSYQTPEPRDSALSTIATASGTQFDAELAGRFLEMMRSMRATVSPSS